MRYYDKQVVQILDGFNKTKNGITEIERARIILRSLGAKAAAFYLKKRGWSIEATLFNLLGV